MSDLEELRRLSDAVVNVGPWEAGTDAAPDNLTLPNATWLYGVRDSGPFYPGFTVGGFEERALAAFAAASMNFVRDLLSNPTSSVSTEGVGDGLSEAWAAVEAALPEAWFVARLTCLRGPALGRPMWEASATLPLTMGTGFESALGDSPVTALQALTARLTAINPDSPVEPDRG